MLPCEPAPLPCFLSPSPPVAGAPTTRPALTKIRGGWALTSPPAPALPCLWAVALCPPCPLLFPPLCCGAPLHDGPRTEGGDLPLPPRRRRRQHSSSIQTAAAPGEAHCGGRAARGAVQSQQWACAVCVVWCTRAVAAAAVPFPSPSFPLRLRARDLGRSEGRSVQRRHTKMHGIQAIRNRIAGKFNDYKVIFGAYILLHLLFISLISCGRCMLPKSLQRN
jgi:hypothetical protein